MNLSRGLQILLRNFFIYKFEVQLVKEVTVISSLSSPLFLASLKCFCHATKLRVFPLFTCIHSFLFLIGSFELLLQSQSAVYDTLLNSARFLFFVWYSVPDYLRTKFDPEIEESERKLETMATNISPEQAQVILEVILAWLH